MTCERVGVVIGCTSTEFFFWFLPSMRIRPMRFPPPGVGSGACVPPGVGGSLVRDVMVGDAGAFEAESGGSDGRKEK